jgi:hypothetical protein
MSTKQMMKRTIISTMFSTVAANMNQTVFIFLDIVIFLRFRVFKEQAYGKQNPTDNQRSVRNIPGRPSLKTQESIDLYTDEIHYPKTPKNSVDQIPRSAAQEERKHPPLESGKMNLS